MSTPNEAVIALIARASAVVGSDYRLAKLLGVADTVVNDWKAGRRTCTPADRARIAGFAREDAVLELIRATLEANEGTKRGEQLHALMGGALRRTGGAIATALLAVGSWTFSPTQAHAATVTAIDTMLGKVKRRRQFPALPA